ncbi:MAG TPA: putative Ig domain-containing protein, partial [Chthoniobacteraceae bacterium]|nr:putative Ig domain-containing protein [Chthoniobacteraceae bacterium]
VLYMDFDGATVNDPLWNGGRTINAPAARMSEAQMLEACQRVAEDFWPFNVTVTTTESRYTQAPVGKRMRCIVTANDAAAPGAGGVAYLDSFAEAGTGPFRADIPCWVFIDDHAKYCAEAASHEYGHTFGLNHDGRISPSEGYYAGHNGPGQTGWAPIMGVGYYQPTVQWSKGEYASANNKEDDLARISNTANGIGYVADESNDVIEGALPLNFAGGNVTQPGLIAKTTDVDFYVFQTTGGTVTLNATGGVASPNLDIEMDLLDVDGSVLASSNPSSQLNASISRTLTAGNYFLRVQGAGVGDAITVGYSKYASIGAYLINGTIGGGSSDSIPVITSPSALSGLRDVVMTYTIKATGSPTSYAVVGTLPPWLNFNPTTGVLSGTPNVYGVTNLVVQATNSAGTGERSLTITVNKGAVSLGEALDAPLYVWASGGVGPDADWAGVFNPSFDGEDSAESGSIPDGQVSFLETTMEGAAIIRFHWRVDSEVDADYLKFFIDGVEQKKISGTTDWIQESFSFPSGPHVVRWEYSKNASGTGGTDRGWVDTISVTLLPPPLITSAGLVIGEEGEVFTYRIEADNLPTSFGIEGTLPDGLTLDVNTGIISGIPTGPADVQLTMTATNFAGTATAPLRITVTPPILTLGESVNAENMEPWVTTGPKLWIPQTVVSADGLDAAQSGPIVHNQNSQISAKVVGPTAIRFKWKVSSEPKFDVLEFLIDGVVQATISGEVDWEEMVMPVPVGQRTLAWRYRKDSGITVGADAGWLDQVSFDNAPLVLGSGVASGRINQPFFHRVAAVNSPSSYQAAGLPPGLTINEANGAITGTPTAIGVYTVNLTITNVSDVESSTLTIAINDTRDVSDLLRPSTYTGLIRATADGKIIGLASLKVGKKQTYSGTLLIEKVRYPFKGKLDLLTPQQHQIRVKGEANVTLTLTLDSRADVERIQGGVQVGSATSNFDAFGTIPSTELPVGAVGKYTVLIEPDAIAPGLPGGTGAATMTVKKTGAVKVTGTLGDGQRFTASAPITVNDEMAFYSAPYKGGGVIGGPMLFDLQATTPTLSSDLEWSRKADVSSPVYPAGFAKSATATGARYTKPAKGVRVIELSSGIIHLIGSDLTFTPREQPFTLTSDNKITVTPAIDSFKAKIATATGLISGSFRSGDGSVRKFSGAVLPTENRGAGVFVGTATTGQMVLEAAP